METEGTLGAGAVLEAKTVSCSHGRHVVFRGVSLRCEPSSLTAILGPSGGGKSTLLRCLAGLHAPDAGHVTCAGEAVDKGNTAFRQRLGFVPQDDIVHRELSPRRALAFAARLRLGARVTSKDVAQRVESLCQQLGIDAVMDKQIRLLSGGQRKRVNIALELLAEPDVVLLDEPASGLDPGTELALIDVLAALAGRGCTVVLTTHSMACLHRYDQLALLAQGQLAFSGEPAQLTGAFNVDSPAEVYRYVQQNRLPVGGP